MVTLQCFSMYHAALYNSMANNFDIQLENDVIIPCTFNKRSCPFRSAVNRKGLFYFDTFNTS